jgi:hypothetical protein
MRLGFLGTNILTLKDDKDITYISITNYNMILFNRYSHWNDDLEMRTPCYESKGFSIRPLIIEHYNENNVKTEY